MADKEYAVKEEWSIPCNLMADLRSDRDKLLEFLTIQALDFDDELASTNGTLHRTFLEGALYALDRVRDYVKENLK